MPPDVSAMATEFVAAFSRSTRRHRPAGFSLDVHRAAAHEAGLTLESIEELRVGLEFREVFPSSEAFYERWHGVPLAFVVRARK